MLSEEVLSASSAEFNEGVESGSVQCLDPNDPIVSKFTDRIGGGKDFLFFKFLFCDENRRHPRDPKCLTEKEITEQVDYV